VKLEDLPVPPIYRNIHRESEDRVIDFGKHALQVKDLVKLGLLTLLKRTYYYLMRTYYYLDLLGPKLR
jgi:hypothetical protein